MLPPKFHGVFGSLLKGDVGVEAGKGVEGETLPPSEPPALRSDPTRLNDTVGQVAVDIYEDGGYLVIKAPIAGVRLSDLDVDVADNVITIRGSRRQCDDIGGDQYLVQECYFGEFSRRIELPHSVNPSRVKATLSKDGILKVFVPREERKVKIVKINEGG